MFYLENWGRAGPPLPALTTPLVWSDRTYRLHIGRPASDLRSQKKRLSADNHVYMFEESAKYHKFCVAALRYKKTI